MNHIKMLVQITLSFWILLLATHSLIGQSAENQLASQRSESIKPPNILFSGVLFNNPKKQRVWYVPGLVDLFPPNTVEGFVFNPSFSLTQKLQNGKLYQLKPNLRYGFGNKKLQAKLTGQYYYQPDKKALWQFSGGRFLEQINSESTLGNLGNTIATFLNEENYLKIYENSYLKIGHSFAPINNFLLTTTLSWNNRNPLQNLAKYDEEEREFTSNIPVNNELPDTEFSEHQAFLWDAQIRWQLGHKYIWQRGRLKSVSPYPAISLTYKGAAKILGSNLAFQKIAIQVSQTFNAGIWGTGQFLLETGDFISQKDLTFIDFNHFNGKRTVYGSFNIGDFQLLDYYQYSTTDYYLQGHYEHQWNGLTRRNKSSFIKPVVAAHYLYTPGAGHYWELGVGLNKLMNVWRVDFYNSWRDGKRENSGVRIGVVID